MTKQHEEKFEELIKVSRRMKQIVQRSSDGVGNSGYSIDNDGSSNDGV